MRSDPPRWAESEEAPEPLRRLLMVSRAELGTAAQVDALAHGLARVLGPTAGLGAPEPAAPPLRTSLLPRSRALQLLAPLGAATGALALWWVSNTSPSPAPSNIQPPAPFEAHARDAVPVTSTEDAPPPAAAAAAPAADPTEDSSDSRGSASHAAAHGAASHPRSAAKGASAKEAALLEKARALLSREPARALALTREHRRRFPQGALAEEREVIAIEALKRLGQDRAASDETDAFGTQYRNSVHHERLQQSPPR